MEKPYRDSPSPPPTYPNSAQTSSQATTPFELARHAIERSKRFIVLTVFLAFVTIIGLSWTSDLPPDMPEDIMWMPPHGPPPPPPPPSRWSSFSPWSSGPSKSELKQCQDPWKMPGFIWYDEKTIETTWTSYEDLAASTPLEGLERRQVPRRRRKREEPTEPTVETESQAEAEAEAEAKAEVKIEGDKENEKEAKIDEDSEQPSENVEAVDDLKAMLGAATPGPALERTTPSITDLLSSKDAATNPDLDFIRNRNIAIVGSSIDRDAVASFCDRIPGTTQKVIQHHRSIYCHLPAFNFTIQSWFTFGIHQGDFHGQDDAAHGTTFEDRFEKSFRPLMEEKTGKPDFLMLSSGRWDESFFWGRKAKLLNGGKWERVVGQGPGPLWAGELAYHRARVAQVIRFLQDLSPGAPVLLRTETNADFDNGDIATFQLNQSLRHLAKQIRVPLFHWSELVTGIKDRKVERKDYMHWKGNSHVNWLFGEMLLWHLRYLSDPQQDTSCLLDRA